jgi:glycosyltransferase involved in cell wall biosynthesis
MITGNNQPLVSVICLCYNQGKFVREALESVFNQTYPNIELIVVDDESEDDSVPVIKDILKSHPEVKFIEHKKNQGNCKSFNEGWRMAKGEYFIDLAADDTLPKNRIEVGVREFGKHDSSYGVQCGDALFLTEEGKVYGRHSKKFSPREGDIYFDLIEDYFVASASLLIRKDVLDKLDGFDESLSYEDFDFLIRSSRYFKYFYTDEILINKREVKNSKSKKQFSRGNIQQLSTLRVCQKIYSLNREPREDEALKARIWYEIRQNIGRFDLALAFSYYKFLKEINKVSRAAYK